MALSRCIGPLLYVIAAAPGFAEVINFDDLDATAGDIQLDSISPYQGFVWNSVSAYTAVPGFPGFNNGIVSPNNAGYSGGEALEGPIIGKVSSSSPFDFMSAYLGAEWYDN